MAGRKPSDTFASSKPRIGVITRIRDNLWQVGGSGHTDPADAAIYLVRFGEEAALIDAGTGRDPQQLKKNIAECLGTHGRVEYLLLTHCHFDHTGGAQAVRGAYGCRIVAHELDAVYLESGDDRVTGAALYGAHLEPFTVDIKLSGPESTLAIGAGTVTAIHCPGHSPGSVVYTTNIAGQLVLFGQDIHGPIHPEFLSDEKQYLTSLARLLKLQADVLLEGHFGIFETKQEVREFIEYWGSSRGGSLYSYLYCLPGETPRGGY
jgi:glyoxylase-like metal-dependent hydrolase (beta-lactamase superfamily II)